MRVLRGVGDGAGPRLTGSLTAITARAAMAVFGYFLSGIALRGAGLTRSSRMLTSKSPVPSSNRIYARGQPRCECLLIKGLSGSRQ